MTIDRAIEILDPEHREHYDGMDEVNEACRMGMEALERMRWILCSERLPEYNGQYLAFSASTGATNIRRFSIRKDAVSGSCGEKKNVWWEYDDEWGVLQVMGITHWMPLPEPPEERGTEK